MNHHDTARAMRIIDANANRAREAMRTAEDIARFAINNPAICGGYKKLRDDLRTALSQLGLSRTSLAKHRDTPGDVGTTLSAPGERDRTSLVETAEAAGARLGEALRAIEESAKLLGLESPSIESIRYAGYELERQLLTTLDRQPTQWRLCVLISESLCSQHTWTDVARLAIEGGADCVQLREKSLSDRELVERARTLIDIAGDRAAVIVNDRIDVALAAGAAGVHLGQGDLSLTDARRIGGSRLCIGVSCSSLDDARTATEQGADVLGVGAMYQTQTKQKPEIAGPGLLRSVLDDELAGALPHLAIGGIDAARAGELAAIGCRGVAVSSVVCGSDDPRGECERVVQAMAGV